MITIEEIWGNGKDIVIKYCLDNQIWWKATNWDEVVWSPSPQKSLIKVGYHPISLEVLNGKKDM